MFSFFRRVLRGIFFEPSRYMLVTYREEDPQHRFGSNWGDEYYSPPKVINAKCRQLPLKHPGAGTPAYGRASRRNQSARSSPQTKSLGRLTHCFQCRLRLEEAIYSNCGFCGWIRCPNCGACGCSFGGRGKNIR